MKKPYLDLPNEEQIRSTRRSKRNRIVKRILFLLLSMCMEVGGLFLMLMNSDSVYIFIGIALMIMGFVVGLQWGTPDDEELADEAGL